jgi:hypothetical protein
MEIKKGATFTSAHKLDTKFKPGPGQKYRDGPKALMKITEVRGKIVYYTYADDETNSASWFATIDQLENGEV